MFRLAIGLHIFNYDFTLVPLASPLTSLFVSSSSIFENLSHCSHLSDHDFVADWCLWIKFVVHTSQ